MAFVFSRRADLPLWAVVLGLLAVSPMSPSFPAGIAVLAIALAGSAWVFRESALPQPLTIVARARPGRP